MNTPTPTPRTDAATYPADCLGKTLVTNRDCSRALETELVTLTGAYTCTHHNDAERTACPVCLVTALTAEREQLRAENSTLRAAQKACEACDEPTAFEVRQLRAELATERARLDWLLSYDGVDWVLSAHKNRKLFEGESDNRALLEAAMKEGAK